MKAFPITGLFLIAFFQLKLAEVAYAQTVEVSQRSSVLSLSGEISQETLTKFNLALSTEKNVSKIMLSSPGGLVVIAMEIASIIHRRGIATEIPLGATCASACSIIFLAGKGRQAHGQLGVHQITSKGGGAVSGVQFILAEMLDVFEDYGVDRRVSRHMLTTPPEEMYFFSELELTEYGINRKGDKVSAEAEKTLVRQEIRFTQFPALSYLSRSDQLKLPDFIGRDKSARSFRTRIRDGLIAGPNFSGHYRLIEIGCGTSCQFVILADARDGRVISFPYGGEDQSEMKLLYNLDSRLVKVNWMRDLNTCTQLDLEFNGIEFIVLKNETVSRVGYCN